MKRSDEKDTEKAIKGIKDRIELELAYRCDADLAPGYIEALELAVEALRKQEPMKPVPLKYEPLILHGWEKALIVAGLESLMEGTK